MLRHSLLALLLQTGLGRHHLVSQKVFVTREIPPQSIARRSRRLFYFSILANYRLILTYPCTSGPDGQMDGHPGSMRNKASMLIHRVFPLPPDPEWTRDERANKQTNNCNSQILDYRFSISQSSPSFSFSLPFPRSVVYC